ncbi:hypothetical protein COBT_002756 [Conglomerata obtusa]
MQNLQKARRIGGKGTPRIPPKKITDTSNDVLAQTLLTFRKNSVKVDASAAVISGDETLSFIKPEMSAILGSKKEPVAYVLRGKHDVVRNKNAVADVPADFEKAAEEMMKEMGKSEVEAGKVVEIQDENVDVKKNEDGEVHENEKEKDDTELDID